MKIIKTGLKDINNIEIKTGDKLQWYLEKLINNKPIEGIVILKTYLDGEGYGDVEHRGFIVKITKNKNNLKTYELNKKHEITLPDTLIFEPKIIN